MNKYFYFVVLVIVSGVIAVIVISGKDEESIDLTSGVIEGITYNETSEVTDYIKIVVNEEDVILVSLDSDNAPITVDNFKTLVAENYYDNTVFHRIIDEFMIQGGTGATTDTIVGEFTSNGYENNLAHTTGVISMARSSDVDSASSGFFICVNDTGCSHLDGDYAAFGVVIAGMDAVLEISMTTTDASDAPLLEQEITSIRFVEIEEE